MRRHLSLTWGAERIAGDVSRFRLWAPDLDALSLATPAGDLGMASAPGGWFEIETDAVPLGGDYAFRLPSGHAVPDPAARAQADDVHGPSRLVDPRAYVWQVPDWPGRPWEEAVIAEVHVGTLTREGTFRAAIDALDHYAAAGFTAIELMPVAQFGGSRGWGYDGVLLYAPHAAYGAPEDMKALVDAAHARGLMVFLDVVYNHFGPDGNYLGLYASPFFHPEKHTPWGAAIAYEKSPVRAFVIENALYWLEEFFLDGLRLDAVDHIDDPSEEPILEELARAVRRRVVDRPVHLATEDARNIVRLHPRDAAGRPTLYTAEWNDDYHNVVHAILTGETDGYYADFREDRPAKLARALAEGFVYQGEVSDHMGGVPRGVPSTGLPLTAFVAFDQNHDQAGNRAFGERLIALCEADRLAAFQALLLLSPQIPLLFMGEEWGETRPFLFFTDFHDALGDAVREGRRREFATFAGFADAAARALIPDPNARATFEASRIDWSRPASPEGTAWLDLHKRLLAVRAAEIVPRLKGMAPGAGEVLRADASAVAVRWRLGDGSRLSVAIALADEAVALERPLRGRPIFRLPAADGESGATDRLARAGFLATLEEGAG